MDELRIAAQELSPQTRRCFLRYRLGAVVAFLAALAAAVLGSGLHAV